MMVRFGGSSDGPKTKERSWGAGVGRTVVGEVERGSGRAEVVNEASERNRAKNERIVPVASS